MRDRATLYLSQLEGSGSGEEAVQPQWDVPSKNLEASLRAYLQNGAQQAFDLVGTLPACSQTPMLEADCCGTTQLLHHGQPVVDQPTTIVHQQ